MAQEPIHRLPRKGFDVPSPEHQRLLRAGAAQWNAWRAAHPALRPKLGYTILRRQDLSGYDFDHADMPFCVLSRCRLEGATFRGADLRGTSLRRASLGRTVFEDTILRHVSLTECDVTGARFVGCDIYGSSAWTLAGTPAEQRGLAISAVPDASPVLVDNLELGHLVCLLVHNERLTGVLETVTAKAVLLLGRFAPPPRKHVLDTLRAGLLAEGLVPIVFDFERPRGRSFTETIVTLAGLARFIIADITEPRSVPLELQATVPAFQVPFVPIMQEGPAAGAAGRATAPSFSMFKDLQDAFGGGEAGRLLPLLTYPSAEVLLRALKRAIIAPAQQRAAELTARKAAPLVTRDARSYVAEDDDRPADG